MMKTSPVASLVVPKPEFLLQFFVVTLDTSTPLDGVEHRLPVDGAGQIAQPVVRGLIRTFGPLDDQPFFVPGLVAVGSTHIEHRPLASKDLIDGQQRVAIAFDLHSMVDLEVKGGGIPRYETLRRVV